MRRIFCVFLVFLLALPVSAVPVPVLMYHHFTDEVTNLPDQCSAVRFREHLAALAEAGYTSVTFGDLLAYVDDGIPLPQKPVVLTADDGYRSVVDTAVPILRESGMRMSAAVVWSRIGQAGKFPHFTWEEGMTAGLELVSHTWDLHGSAGYGVLTEKGVPDPRFLADADRMRDLPGLCGTVFVYPYGKYSGDTEALLAALGYRITVTTRDGIADIRQGKPESLRLLPRFGMDDRISGEALLARLERESKNLTEKLAE